MSKVAPSIFLLFMMVVVLGAACAGLRAAEPEAADRPDEADLARGRQFAEQFYRGDLVELRMLFSDEMKETFSLEVLDGHRRRMEEDLGAETEVVGERIKSQEGYRLYIRQARFEKKGKDELFELQWGWNQEGKIVGFLIKPVGV